MLLAACILGHLYHHLPMLASESTHALGNEHLIAAGDVSVKVTHPSLCLAAHWCSCGRLLQQAEGGIDDGPSLACVSLPSCCAIWTEST